MSHPEPDSTDGVGALRKMRSERVSRQTPPSRNPRPPAEQPAEAEEQPPAEPEQPAGKPPRPGGHHEDTSPRRRRNVALKRVQDAANSWAAQAAKYDWRTSELGEFAQAAKHEGVDRTALAEVVQAAADRHGVEPTAILPRPMARLLGFTRRP